MITRKKILWLCSWYPNRLEPFNGDFIQRHARAASMYNDIHVIHLAADSTGTTTQKETTIHSEENLTEQVIYYKKGHTVWDRLKAHYRWLFLYRQALRNYMVKKGKPDLVHVHVPYKSGILAVWLWRKYKVPYVLTEHWGIYNDVELHNYESKSKAFKYITRQVIGKAAAFIPVSRFLGDGVNNLVIKKEFEVVPNVADTRLFFYKENKSPVFRFIHVSNMVPLKNAEGIVRSFAELHRQNSSTELVMVGDKDPGIRELAVSLKLSESAIRFKGEISYEQVAREMQEAHCLVLFSNMENSPCVIGEALCCGMPVISTAVGGIPELVDTSNSILVSPKNEAALTSAMNDMIDTYNRFNRVTIAGTAKSRFSYETVGRQLQKIYNSVMGNR